MKSQKKNLSFEKDLLRLPGQSVSEELDELIDSKVNDYLFVIFASVLLILFSWISYFQEIKPNPYLMTFVGLVIGSFSGYKVLKLRKDVHNLKQGIKGERYVGQTLEELRADGYRIFQDVLGDGFNIDHVLIGPAGIFVVETKTWGNSASIKNASYDGRTLRLNNHPVPKNPIFQVQSSARWLSEVLQKSIGTRWFVKPIIALPSKFIEPIVNQVLENEGVYMLNPKNIRSFLASYSGPNSLSEEQINQISFHLSRLIASGR
ncbi:MAG: NERD domain-containing protein [Candidatus Pacebacteria bacterium]|nr:NERD domain-containing protein [Candidatus Paceibacterota bacterium]